MMQSSHPPTASLTAPYTIVAAVEIFGQLTSLLGPKSEHTVTRKHGTMRISRGVDGRINFEIIPDGDAKAHVNAATGHVSCSGQTIGTGKSAKFVRQCHFHVATGEVTVPEFVTFVTSGLNAKKFSADKKK